MQKTKVGVVEFPTLYSVANPPKTKSRLTPIRIAAAMSSIGAMAVLTSATIILINTLSLERIYGHEARITTLVAATACLLAFIQFIICCVCAAMRREAAELMWTGHLVLSTTLVVTILHGFANGMHHNYVGYTFLQFSSLDSAGGLLLAFYLKLIRQPKTTHNYVSPL